MRSSSTSSVLDTFVVGCPVIGDPLSSVDRKCTGLPLEMLCGR